MCNFPIRIIGLNENQKPGPNSTNWMFSKYFHELASHEIGCLKVFLDWELQCRFRNSFERSMSQQWREMPRRKGSVRDIKNGISSKVKLSRCELKAAEIFSTICLFTFKDSPRRSFIIIQSISFARMESILLARLISHWTFEITKEVQSNDIVFKRANESFHKTFPIKQVTFCRGVKAEDRTILLSVTSVDGREERSLFSKAISLHRRREKIEANIYSGIKKENLATSFQSFLNCIKYSNQGLAPVLLNH